MSPSWRVAAGLSATLVALIVVCVVCGLRLHDYEAVVVLAALALVAESTRYSAANTTISVNSILLGAAVILTGPLGAAAIGLASQLPSPPRRVPVSRVFNLAMNGLIGVFGGLVYLGLGGHSGGSANTGPLHIVGTELLPLAVATVAMLFVNAGCVSLMIAVNAGPPVLITWRRLVRQVGRTYLGYGVVSFLFAVLWDQVGLGPATVLVMFAPLVLAQWSYAQQHAESVAHERTVSSLVAAVDARDPIMRGRNARVANVSEVIGNELRLSPAQADALHFAALLHDVGMVAPVNRARADMRQADLERIRRHPARGVEMLRSIDFLGVSITAIRHHHERWDGRGYPDGLAGKDIPLLARVLAVADTFCALVPRVGLSAAMEQLQQRSGAQFDPDCVDALARVAAAAEAFAVLDNESKEALVGTQQEGRWLDHDLPEVSDLLAGEGAAQ